MQDAMLAKKSEVCVRGLSELHYQKLGGDTAVEGKDNQPAFMQKVALRPNLCDDDIVRTHRSWPMTEQKKPYGLFKLLTRAKCAIYLQKR